MEDKKVIIVTGANCGIGFETAKGLCQLGHDVVISVRDDAKGDATVSAIKSQVPNAQVMYIIMELSDSQSVRSFVEKFLATGKPLHVLLNNAGLFKSYKNQEDFAARADPTTELTMAVNCMGTFLLTNLLLEKLKETGAQSNPARIVNVSSGMTIMRKSGDFYIDDLMMEEKEFGGRGQCYRNSKVALNLWSRVLATKLEGSNVIVNTVCPGFIPSTELAREYKASTMTAILMWLLDSYIGRLFAKSQPLSEGQRRLVAMALEDETKTNGIFYHDNKPTEETEEVNNQENLDKIWELCVKFSGL